MKRSVVNEVLRINDILYENSGSYYSEDLEEVVGYAVEFLKKYNEVYNNKVNELNKERKRERKYMIDVSEEMDKDFRNFLKKCIMMEKKGKREDVKNDKAKELDILLGIVYRMDESKGEKLCEKLEDGWEWGVNHYYTNMWFENKIKDEKERGVDTSESEIGKEVNEKRFYLLKKEYIFRWI